MKTAAAVFIVAVSIALFMLFVGQISHDARLSRLETILPCRCPEMRPALPKRRTGDLPDDGELRPRPIPIPIPNVRPQHPWADQGPIDRP